MLSLCMFISKCPKFMHRYGFLILEVFFKQNLLVGILLILCFEIGKCLGNTSEIFRTRLGYLSLLYMYMCKGVDICDRLLWTNAWVNSYKQLSIKRVPIG